MRLGLRLSLSNSNKVVSSFDPNSISGLTHWYAPDSIVQSGGNMTSWDDKIGTLDFGPGPSAPTLSTLNGKTCLSMNGTGQSIATGSAFNESGTMFWVQETSDTAYVTANNNTAGGYALVAASGQTFGFRAGFASPPIYVNGVIASSITNRDTAYTALNGAVKVVAHVGFNTASTGWAVLKWGQNDAVAAWNYTGKLAEILIYNSSLSSDDRGLVESYLLSKYSS